MFTLFLANSLVVTLDASTNSSASTKRSVLATQTLSRGIVMAVANPVSVGRSESVEAKRAFLTKHLKSEQFASARSLVDAGVITIDALAEKGMDAILTSCQALALDELKDTDALFMSYSFDTTSVARINSTLAETLKGRGIQASGGITKVHATVTLYVTPDADVATLKDKLALSLMTNASHSHADYQDMLEDVLAAREEANVVVEEQASPKAKESK